jgi:hypothetical protein
MKVTRSQLKRIIKEELNEVGNYSAGAGAVLRNASIGVAPTIANPGGEPELTLGEMVSELNALLEEWEAKEYLSDEARYQGYYEDIEQVVERYDPCAHPDESCADAHPDQSHEECTRDQEESDEE